jgi:HD-like signal output (HDOD) protein
MANMQSNPPDVKTLRRLRPLSEFSDDQLQSLANQLSVISARKGDYLIKAGCTEKYSLFILKGVVTQTANDGKQSETVFDEEQELNPIAQLRPSLYDVRAAGSVLYLKIDMDLLTEFAHLTLTGSEDISVHHLDNDDAENPLTFHLFKDLMSDKIQLPSLPEVAQRIQQAFQDDTVDAEQIANILMIDPAITGKLIKIANSPLYQGLATTNTLQAAIVRMGLNTTYKQVMAYAANELFRSHSDEVSERMKQLWPHSRKVAAISRVLARNTQLFDPDEAMLAGLMHDLGVIVIMEYMHLHDELDFKSEDIVQTVESMRPQITGMLMRKWNFSSEMITVGEECEHWFRNPDEKPDLCDLVLIAQYHAMMGTDTFQSLPPINTIPAMTKLKMGPSESMRLIKESNREIKEIERLLH